MTRAGHRADARGAGRAHPRQRATAATARSPASRSGTCRRSRPTSTRRSRSRTSARSPSTSPTAGCSTSSPTPRRSGCGSRPDEGADIVRITEMIKAAAQRAAAGRPSGAAGLRRDHDRPAVGAGPRPGELDCATSSRSRPGRSTGSGRRPGPARSTARRAAPARQRRMADAPRAGASWRSASDVPPRGHPRHGVHRPARRGDDGRRRTGRSSRASRARPGSPGFADYVVDPTDPFPDGFTVGDIWALTSARRRREAGIVITAGDPRTQADARRGGRGRGLGWRLRGTGSRSV